MEQWEPRFLQVLIGMRKPVRLEKAWPIFLFSAFVIGFFLILPSAFAKQFEDKLATDFFAGKDDNLVIQQNVKGSIELAPYGLLNSWQPNAAPSGAQFYLASSVTYNGKIYITGGLGSSGSYSFGSVNATNALNSISYGTIQSDGTIGSQDWKTVDDSSKLPQPTFGHGSVVVNERLYILGGRSTANVPLNAVYWGKIIGFDGSIKAYYQPNTWTAVAPLPVPLYRPAVAAFEGRIYVIGGQDQNNRPQATVYYAMVEPAGNIRSWSLASSPLPVGLIGHAAAISNNHIYVVGGSTTGELFNVSTNAYMASIDPVTGDLSGWTTLPPLLEPVFGAAAAISGGKLWVTGGQNAGTAKSTVMFARLEQGTGLIPAAGQRDSWTYATELPVPMAYHNLVSFNGHLYALGGANNNGIQTSSYVADLLHNKNYNQHWEATTPLFQTVYGGGALPTWTGHTAVLVPPLTSGQSTSSSTSSPEVYVLGGGPNQLAFADGSPATNNPATAGAFPNVYSSTVDPNGTLQVWSIAGKMSASGNTVTGATDWPSILHSSAVCEGRVYMIGGINGANMYVWGSNAACGPGAAGYVTQTARTVVMSAAVGSSTSSGLSFTDTQPIPLTDSSGIVLNPLCRMRAVSHNGYLYVLGGISRTNDGAPSGQSVLEYEDRVWFCRPMEGVISSPGVPGGWATTTSLPYLLYDFAAAVANGRVYIFGGRENQSPNPTVVHSEVYFAKINADGTLGAWTNTTSIGQSATTPAVQLAEHDVVFTSGKFYVTGGQTGAGNLSPYVYSCTPDPATGQISGWEQSFTQLEYGVAGHASVAYNGSIYLLGGRYDPADAHTSSAYRLNLSDLYQFRDIDFAWEGTFDRFLDLGSDQMVQTLNWDATSNNETLQVKCRYALDQGGWSDWTLPQALGPVLVQRFVRYLEYKFYFATADNDPNSIANTPVLQRVFLDYTASKYVEEDGFQINHNQFDPQTQTLQIAYKTRTQDVANVILRVYNLEGQLIRRQDIDIPASTPLPATGIWTWDGTNNLGELVANGVYIIQYNSGGTHKIRKVLILKR